jgi:deoxyribose-phosphate aldolase
VKSQLRDQTTLIASVVGFPHGANRTVVKVQEAKLAIEDGAVELDMVMAIGDFLNGNDTAVHDDIAAVVNQALPLGVPVKVILETCFLTNEEVVKACQIVESAKAQYVKTSTGFGPQGATREVVEIMLATVDGRLGVKASGGIRTWHECVDYLSMGCTRIGVGDPLSILNGSPD